KRPSLFDNRTASRPQISEEIILGPPKLSFASSSSSRRMAFDFDTPVSGGISSPTAVADDDHNSSPRFDRFRMQARDKEREKNVPADRNEPRTSTPARRGFNKDEPDATSDGIRTTPWTTQRQPRKSFGTEDGDRFRRATAEVAKDRPLRYENFGRDRDRPVRTKRDEGSWILDDGAGRERENNTNNNRLDRDGDQRGEPKGHSMEEFQRWKARMKASQAPEERRTRTPIEEPTYEEEEYAPVTPPKEKQEENLDAFSTPGPAITENGVDRFFNLWNAPAVSKSPVQTPTTDQKPHVGKSRFTSFFSPQDQTSPSPKAAEQPPQSHAQAPPPAQSGGTNVGDGSTPEDKEGFRRILQMLGGTGGAGGLSLGGPQPQPSPPIHNSLPPMQYHSKQSASPAGMSLPHQPPPQQHAAYTPSQPSPSPLQNLQMPSRDANADFLLGLMRQSQHASQGPPPLPSLNNHSYGGPSQMPPPPQISTSPQAFQRPPKNMPPTPMYDDPAITGFRQRPNQDPMMQQRGPPPLPMEQHQIPNWLNQAQQQGHQQGHQQGPGLQQGPGGLQSLLGRQLAPPPGFTRPGPGPGMPQHGPLPPVSHGPLPPFMGPPPGANISPLPFQMNPMPPNFPPGGPPPPPFFGMNGPPPPFPMPFHHDGPMIGIPGPGPHFGFPHDALKNPPHHPGKPKY
ncbi:hypothetical protein DFH27DRAFT_487325, partial [Peziza echinospora]